MEVFYPMNNLLKEKASCWRIRLKKCMNAERYTQASLAEALNNKYGTCYDQKSVSRWLNTGAKTKNGEVGFPKYENMLLIADFFGVDIGYLTGETDEDLFTLEQACSYMGLNSEAIKAIRGITSPEKEDSWMHQDMRISFNMFLSANKLPDFFHALYDLYLISKSSSRTKEHVFENIDRAIDLMRESEYAGKIARYELNEALILLINEVFPNPYLSDLSINVHKKQV